MNRREDSKTVKALWEMDHPLARMVVEIHDQGVDSGDLWKFVEEWKQNHPEEANELKDFLNEYIWTN